jgi:hypothetical protein
VTRMNWEAAAQRDVLRERPAHEPAPISRRASKLPTEKQLALLAALARELDVGVPDVRTGRDAATAIDWLLKRKRGQSTGRPSQQPSKPTAKQLDYLNHLTQSTGDPMPQVRTRAEAAKAIEALASQTRPTRRQLRAIDELAQDVGVSVPRPTTRADAECDLAALRALAADQGRHG